MPIPLTREELERPRLASDLHPWVMAKIDEIGATEEGKWAIRMRQGLAKILIEESFPLAHFASYYFEASCIVEISQVLGSQSHDARVVDRRSNSSGIQYLEVTQAHEGENEHLRMAAFKEYGHVSALGTVHKEGTKRRDLRIEVASEARSHSEILADRKARIRAAARRKSGKTYPDATGLVIAFDDHIAFRDPEDMEALRSIMIRDLLPMLQQFRLVALVGASGKRFLGLVPEEHAI